MPELYLQYTGDNLEITFSEYHASVPWADIAPNEETGKHIYKDASDYGRTLFNVILQDEGLRSALTTLDVNERLMLVIEDYQVAAIPWEYLRDQNNKLLSSRFNFVRRVPKVKPSGTPSFSGPLKIVAIPVSPLDHPQTLNIEQEWERLIDITMKSGKALTLLRVRPPTLSDMEQALSSQDTTIVHFMGHSDRREGEDVLLFENMYGRTNPVEATTFADSLAATNVFLVVSNSCYSATTTANQLGNISRIFVQRGVPYALGMQFVLPDNAATALSQTFYNFILKDRSVEEAMRRTRGILDQNTALQNRQWVAGIPALYTHLSEPVSPIRLSSGLAVIEPNPKQLKTTYDLAALPQATHFVGRADKISEILEILLSSTEPAFVVIHGLGGVGKTALVRAVAERTSWHYNDTGLAISFETFASLDSENRRVINEHFIDTFCNKLARFYGINPTEYNTNELQDEILQIRAYERSLLVLDNFDTLIDAQPHGDSATKTFASFISRLGEGKGDVILVSRIEPPLDWGNCKNVYVLGLLDDAGASLFRMLLPLHRRKDAPYDACLKLSNRVQGHPLSIRLLAGQFTKAERAMIDLSTFLNDIENELKDAEQTTPTSLKQATLYACMAYSIKRLESELYEVLRTTSLFKAPFTANFAAKVLDNKRITTHLHHLAGLGLLEKKDKFFQDGQLTRFELHSMLRWYLQLDFSPLDPNLQERYKQTYEELGYKAYQMDGYGYDQNQRIRFLVQESIPDFETVLTILSPERKAKLAFYLAKLYLRLGQTQRSLTLYEQALQFYEDMNDARGIILTQSALGSLYRVLGQLKSAQVFFEKANVTVMQSNLSDAEATAIVNGEYGRLLAEMDHVEAALEHFGKALIFFEHSKNRHNVSSIQREIADLYLKQGDWKQALDLYEQALLSQEKLDDIYGSTITQRSVAVLLWRMNQPQDALEILEQVLNTVTELDDPREMAITQDVKGEILADIGKAEDSLKVLRQASQLKQQFGDNYGLWLTQQKIANILAKAGRFQESTEVYDQASLIERNSEEKYVINTFQNDTFPLIIKPDDNRQDGKLESQYYGGLEQFKTANIQSSQDLFMRVKTKLIGLFDPEIGSNTESNKTSAFLYSSVEDT